MKITDIIRKRHSVRTFDADKQLSNETVEKIRTAISDAKAPFGSGYTIKFEKFDLEGPLKPSTYGTIQGASWYLLLGIDDMPDSALAAGFAMEQVVLKATELGLGTCWIAATFKGTDFAVKADMPPTRPLKIICPVGYPKNKRRIVEKFTRMALKSDGRKPFDAMFSQSRFGEPLAADSPFRKPLEMLRLAPSAKNSQPWRALVVGDRVYFYYELKTEASILDLGIGLYHFDATAKAEGLKGQWIEGENAPMKQGWIHVVTYQLSR